MHACTRVEVICMHGCCRRPCKIARYQHLGIVKAFYLAEALCHNGTAWLQNYQFAVFGQLFVQNS